jgi:integrase
LDRSFGRRLRMHRKWHFLAQNNMLLANLHANLLPVRCHKPIRMATLQLDLDRRRKKVNGTYPLVFKITCKRKQVMINTSISILEEDFDSENGIIKNAPNLNKELIKLDRTYRERFMLYIIQNQGNEDPVDLKNYILNKSPNELTIADFWDKTIKDLINMGRLGGAKIYTQSKSTIEKHTNLHIPFQKFSYRDLLQLEQNLHLAGMSVNGMGVYLRCFRTICNSAIKQDLVSFEWYPFRKYLVKKEKTTPRVISKKELCSYFNMDIDPSHPSYIYWNVGKLIFMLRGINITDLLLLDKSNIRNGRVIYKRAKTGKFYSIKLNAAIENVLLNFTPNETLLGLVTTEQINSKKRKEYFNQRIKVINKHLEKLGHMLSLEEKLTTYVFRYSYANLAKQMGYSKDIIAEALGHEYGNAVTGIYLEQFDQEVVDKMNQDLIEAVLA